MSTLTPREGLTVDTTADAFSTAVIAANWGIIDSFPGIYTNTAAAVTTEVSTWGSAQLGMYAYATDTGLLWQWNGSALVRPLPAGKLGKVLNTSGGSFTSTSPATVASVTVTVLAGNRDVEIIGIVPSVTNSGGTTLLTLVEDSTVLQTVPVPQTVTQSALLYAQITPTSGSHTFLIKCAIGTSATTSVLAASSTQPIVLTVKEV